LTAVPAVRIHNCNQSPARPTSDYVLYGVIATRRLHWNSALDRAREHCAGFAKPWNAEETKLLSEGSIHNYFGAKKSSAGPGGRREVADMASEHITPDLLNSFRRRSFNTHSILANGIS
jgi:hypothetical protein